jgi:hypothetical protein
MSILIFNILIEHASKNWCLQKDDMSNWNNLSNTCKSIRDQFRFNKIKLKQEIDMKSFPKAAVKFLPESLRLELFDKVYMDLHCLHMTSACMLFLENKSVEVFLLEPTHKKKFQEKAFVSNLMVEYEDVIRSLTLHIDMNYELNRLPVNLHTLKIDNNNLNGRPITKNVHNLKFAFNLKTLIISNNKYISHLPPNLTKLELKRFHRMPLEYFPKTLTKLKHNCKCRCFICDQEIPCRIDNLIQMEIMNYIEIECGLLEKLILHGKHWFDETVQKFKCKMFKYYANFYMYDQHVSKLPLGTKIAYLGLFEKNILPRDFSNEKPFVSIDPICFQNLQILKLFRMRFGKELDLSQTQLELVAIITLHRVSIHLPQTTKKFYLYEICASGTNLEINPSMKNLPTMETVAYGGTILHADDLLEEWAKHLIASNVKHIYYDAPNFTNKYANFQNLIQPFPRHFYQVFIDF